MNDRRTMTRRILEVGGRGVLLVGGMLVVLIFTIAPIARAADVATLRFVGPQQASGAKPYGIARRVELVGNRVVGSPDPPPPYRVRRVYPELKLNFPIGVFRQPGSDRLLVIQQPRSSSPTTIRRFRDEPHVRETELLLDADETAYDITFHPKFAENGQMFVGSNGPFSGPGAAKKTRVTRYHLQPQPPYAFDPKSAKEIIAWESDGHNGGAIAFGLDGMLYVTSGDGTSDSDTNLTGQGLDHLLAKVLRIDVDHPDKERAYGVPADNPFVGRAGTQAGDLGLWLAEPVAHDGRSTHGSRVGRQQRPGSVGTDLFRAQGRQLRLERHGGESSVLFDSQGGPRSVREAGGRTSRIRSLGR